MFKKIGLLICLSLLALHVAIADTALSKVENLGSMQSLEVPEIRVKTKNGLMIVQADFLNKSIYNQEVYYRFKWVDADGFQIGDDEAWKFVTLIGKQKSVIKTVSPTPLAKDFKIELQTPRNKSIINPF
jgi:uncharacterized protein YcfL